MTHKGKPHKRASKEELDKRRARQVEVKELKKRSDAGEDVRTTRASRSKEKEDIVLNRGKQIRESGIKAGTSFKEAKELVPGLESSEFGKFKREIFAEEKPGQKAALDIASVTAQTLLGGGLASGAVKAFSARLATKGAIKAGFAQQAAAIPGKDKIVTGANAVIKNTFRTNIKSQFLSMSFISKLGLTIGAAGIAVSAIGSYPFAGFIKEEALQTLSFGINAAKQAGDLDGQQDAIDQVNEVLNPTVWDKLIGAIPYANVQRQLADFYLAAATKNEIDQKSLDKQRQIAEGEIESDFARERRISDEAAFERKREFGEEESERFADIEEDRTAAENEQKRLESIFFQLIRDKKFAEAEEFRKTNFPT